MQINKFEKEYTLKSYECDKNGELRLLTLMNILQDIADSHASNLGIGIEHCLACGLAWVGSNYELKINRLPKWHEKIKVITWPAEQKLLGAIRDFAIYDEKNSLIITASSLWVLINFEKKRPVALKDNLPPYTVVEERILPTEFPKLPEAERIDFERHFQVRFDDIDVNNHVNNAIYILWATESIVPEFRLSHRPESIEVAFKKEGLFGEEVRVETMQDNLISQHSIKVLSDGRELARLRIKWK